MLHGHMQKDTNHIWCFCRRHTPAVVPVHHPVPDSFVLSRVEKKSRKRAGEPVLQLADAPTTLSTSTMPMSVPCVIGSNCGWFKNVVQVMRSPK